MNKLTSRYATEMLVPLFQSGEIAAYAYEAIKLRLAAATFYTPDFLVVFADGAMELHEVKGFWEDDARVKVKVAASAFPWFRFVAVQRRKGQWQTEHFEPFATAVHR